MAIPSADDYLDSLIRRGANKRVRTDAGDVEKHSIEDQLLLERRLRDRERQANSGLGIGLFKIKPGGPAS